MSSGSKEQTKNQLQRSLSVGSPSSNVDELELHQDITLKQRKLLTDLDWSGESIPKSRQVSIRQSLTNFGVTARRHFSFESEDHSIMAENTFSPRRVREALEKEIDEMRRNFDRSVVENDMSATVQSEESPQRPVRRLQRLQVKYDELYANHYHLIEEYLKNIEYSEKIIEKKNEEIRTAKEATEYVRAEAEEEIRQARAEAEEVRREAENIRMTGNDGRNRDRFQERDRRRTNFGQENFGLGEILKIIKEFDGSDSTKLEGFLGNCKFVLDHVREGDKADLLELILKNKLTDRAMRDMKYEEIRTFEELEKELQSLYGSRKSISSLQRELSNLRQQPGEDISSYGARAERVTAELVEEMAKDKETLGERRMIQEAIRMVGKAGFENGLHGHFQMLVKAKDFKTLHEAVDGAIDLAKTMDIRPKNQGGATFKGGKECYKCKEIGHFAKDCPTSGNTSKKQNLPVGVQKPTRINAFTNEGKDKLSIMPLGAYQIA